MHMRDIDMAADKDFKPVADIIAGIEALGGKAQFVGHDIKWEVGTGRSGSLRVSRDNLADGRILTLLKAFK